MRTRFRMAGIFLALALVAGGCAAQAFPAKPVRIVVGYAPGGGTDVNIRMLAPKLSENLGQPVIIENKPGAAASIATEYVAKAPPDGYTLLAGASGEMIFNVGLFALPYDADKAFAPITLFNYDPMVLAVNPSIPANTIGELIALAKTRPGQLFHASAASAFHMTVELFNKEAGIKIVHVPYKGAAPALTAAVSGEASLIVLSIPPLAAYLKSGKLRALAINGARRSRFFPDIPTFLESGVDFEGVVSWAGVFAPAGTPSAIIDRLYGGLSAAIRDEAMTERLHAMGRDTSTIGIPPAEFDLIYRKELAKWPKAIRDLGIRGG